MLFYKHHKLLDFSDNFNYNSSWVRKQSPEEPLQVSDARLMNKYEYRLIIFLRLLIEIEFRK